MLISIFTNYINQKKISPWGSCPFSKFGPTMGPNSKNFLHVGSGAFAHFGPNAPEHPHFLIFGPGGIAPNGSWLSHNYSLFKIFNIRLTYEIFSFERHFMLISIFTNYIRTKKFHPGVLAHFLIWATVGPN